MARVKSSTLEQRLIQNGVDISAPEFTSELNAHVSAAMNAIPRPVNPADEEMPEGFKQVAAKLHAFGRLGTLLQVVLISGGIGPIINLGLILADTVRIRHAITFFEHNPFIATLLAVVTIFAYTYLAFIKADLKYILRKNERERFSLRRVYENIRYTIGAGSNWTPRTVSPSEMEYERISGFYRLFKWGILALLVGSAFVTVLADMEKNPNAAAQHITGAAGSVIITMLLLSALDLQVDRSYKSYMQTDGGRQITADFFEASIEQWQTSRRLAGEEARWAFLALALKEVQANKALPATTSPSHSMPLIAPIQHSTNGHSSKETTN